MRTDPKDFPIVFMVCILVWLYEGFSSHLPAFVKVLQNRSALTGGTRGQNQ
jgi:hypothetical protein